MGEVNDVRRAVFELERVLLDGLMLNNEAIAGVLKELPEASVTAGVHRSIYSAINALHAREAIADAVTVSEEMERQGALREDVLLVCGDEGPSKIPLKPALIAMAAWIHATVDVIIPVIAEANGRKP